MTYTSVILSDNPTHFWRLADPVGSGVLFDLVAASRLGIFSNVLYSGAGYTGPNSDGGSCFFTATQWVPRTHAPALPAVPLSLEAWVWSMDDPVAPMSVVSSAGGFQFYIDASRKLHVHGTNNDYQAAAAMTPEVWHHLLATFTSTTDTLYEDGVSVASGADANVTAASDIAIGANLSGTTGLGGYMAEVATYGTALSAARAAAHFAAADAISSVPVLGSFSGNPGTTPVPGGSSDASLLQQILNAVRKTFPTT